MPIKPGDTVLFDNRGWGPFCVTIFHLMKYRRSECNHAGKVSKVWGNLVNIHEAIYLRTKGDFKPYAYEKAWLREKVRTGEIYILRPLAKMERVAKVCKSYEYLEYDWWNIFLMPFKLSMWVPDETFCSAACVRVDYDCSNKKIDLAYEFQKHHKKITPMDIFLSKQYRVLEWEEI